MHLSFIDYDREENQLGDHIHREDMVSPTVKQNGLDAFQLGSNGFLRRKSDTVSGALMDSPLFRPTAPASTFSALGNKAATPGKAKSQQERQLISGRYFRDILEACRPRISGMRLPSALVSILKLHDFVEEKEKARAAGVPFEESKREFTTDHTKQMPLREWGTIHFNEFPVRPKPKALRSDSPTSRRSPSESKGDKDPDSESGSHASSFMSHVSSVFGMSYDRVLWDHYDSPLVAKTAFQIQRSPSLEFDRLNPALLTEGDSGMGDDYTSVGTDNASGGQASGDEDPDWNQADNDTTTSQQSKQAKHLETLRKLMDSYDEHVWAPASTKVPVMGDINVIRPESMQHVESEVTIASTKRGTNMPGGGLEAALSQYSSATPLEGQPNTLLTRRASGSFLPNQGRSGGSKDRTRAQSPIFPNLAQFQDRTTRAASPMLYPSMLSLTSQHQNVGDPPNILKGERGPGHASRRSLAMESNTPLSRDTLGLTGIFSASNYEYGGLHNPMVSGVSSFLL